jgi:hypothetical protein
VLHDDDGMAVQISDRITQFYRQIDRLPEMEYHLSSKAFKRYQGVYKQLERLRVTHAHSGMAAVYSKMEGYIGRLALNLHVLWELAEGKDCPSAEIPLHIMEMAIQLSRFYMGQVKVIHANSDDDNLPSHILKMIELSKRLETNGKDGWLKAKQVQETFSKKKRPPAQTVRDWMNEAVNMGYGQTRNTGNRLEYYWNKDDGDNDPNSDPSPNSGTLEEPEEKTSPQSETTNHQGIEDNTGNLGNNFSSHPSSFKDKESPPNNSEDDLTQSCLEGGVNSQPSPTLTQDVHNQELESVSAVEESLGNDSPTISQVPQECDNSISDVTVDTTPVQSAPVEQEEVEQEAVSQEEITSGAELAQSESNDNAGEVGKTYLVHQDVDGCVEWVEAVLIDVPNPPLSTGWIFMGDDGQQFPVVSWLKVAVTGERLLKSDNP